MGYYRCTLEVCHGYACIILIAYKININIHRFYRTAIPLVVLIPNYRQDPIATLCAKEDELSSLSAGGRGGVYYAADYQDSKKLALSYRKTA